MSSERTVVRLGLQVDTEHHDALMSDRHAFKELCDWLKTTPDPLARDCTRMDMLDESGTLFRCLHWARDDRGSLIVDGEPCPDGGNHLTDLDECHFCDGRQLRQEVTNVATREPLPPSVLRYLTPMPEGIEP